MVERQKKLQDNLASPKTSELLAHLGEIREVTNGIVRENLILGLFNDTMRELALNEGLTGFFKVSIQSRSGNLWQTFSGEDASLAESLITPEKNSDPTEGRRGSVLSCLFLDTKESHEIFCYPGGGNEKRDNVTNFAYVINPYAQQSARIAFTLGQFYKMTSEEEKIWFCSTNMSGGEKRSHLLQECLKISFGKINAAMEKVDSVESFLHANPKEWKKVFGNDELA